MTGKAHDQLMRTIRGYIKVLDDSAILQTPNLFIESTYLDANNLSRPCYLLTKKGCDMVARLIRRLVKKESYLQFTATYVTKFEEMEKQIKSNVPQISREQQLVSSIYSGGLDAMEGN
ncbi:hypothetical protein psyc5s11_29220 [Clostridium gelidum]|uniref:KilA-N DNA-binding domain-containing protein n=1 Tax=Clostridium gelidum TaxID=704125 RepID=A0ABM7T7F7_9CLOT|nr:Rha family transcriptional regulator [Clostridium gelidum]BCZ46855.1 hypothetical protein psyc5s11_29220 [Clostridium gelidum]